MCLWTWKCLFFPIPARGGTSVVALPLFFLLNCEKWSAWAQVLEPGSGLCFFTHVLFNQKPSSLSSKCPFHYLAFMADVEGGSSLFKPATHVTNISEFMELIIKADQWAWGNAWVFFFLPKVSNMVKQQLFTRDIQLEYVAPAYILQLHLQIRPDTRKLCSFTPGSAVWDCLKPNLHPCVGFVWVVQFQIQDLSLCPCSW